MTDESWKSWLGVVAVVLGLLVAAHQATELTRHGVMLYATPAEPLPPAACPADELAEEGLAVAECRQMVSNVRNYTASAPDWFAGFAATLAALGVIAGVGSVIAGTGLLDQRPWGPSASVSAFAALVLIDLGAFVGVLSAGPILRDLYLWDQLSWFAMHLMLLTAAVAGMRSGPVPRMAGAAADQSTSAAPSRPFSRTASICHLLLALSIFFLFASSWWMLALPLPSEDFVYRAFPFQLHKNLGLTLVVILGILLYARFRHPPRPAGSERLPAPAHRLATTAHILLYVLILLVAWSGYMSSSYSGWSTTLWWLVELPHWGYEDEELNILYSDLHLWTCWALLLVMAAHIAGALYHAFRADGFVQRMLRT